MYPAVCTARHEETAGGGREQKNTASPQDRDKWYGRPSRTPPIRRRQSERSGERRKGGREGEREGERGERI